MRSIEADREARRARAERITLLLKRIEDLWPAIPEDQPPETNQQLWQQITSILPSRSLKMLMQQQAEFISFEMETLTIGIVYQWMGFIQERKVVIEAAFSEAMGFPVTVALTPIDQTH